MIYRKYNAPNVEYNEIDRSQYDNDINSAAVGTMTFTIGFADKGEDYDPKYSRSMSDFVSTYGYPTNEAERYFYSTAKEVFKIGGRIITAKIPYENESKDKFPYTIYKADPILKDIAFDNEFSSIVDLDDSIRTFIELSAVPKNELSNSNIPGNDEIPGLMTMEGYDNLLIGNVKPEENSIIIIDIARNKYSRDNNILEIDNVSTKNYLGYVPVLVSPMNALYYQKLIDGDLSTYNVVDSFQTIYSSNIVNEVKYSSISSHFATPLKTSEIISDTVSKTAAGFFPTIKFISNNRLNRNLLKQIGIVVFKMVSDPSNNNKINFVPVESFIGSLDRKAIDPITKKNIFIDNIVNEQSTTINVFSNFNFEKSKEVTYTVTSKKKTDEIVINPLPKDIVKKQVSSIINDIIDKTNDIVDNLNNLDKREETIVSTVGSPYQIASTFLIRNQIITSLGFFESQCTKKITTESIESSLTRILENCKNPNKIPIDIIVDGGISNIAQYMASLNDEEIFYEPEFDIDNRFSLNSSENSIVWKKILEIYDNFAKNIRKDCIFIADGLRSFCLDGNQSLIRRTSPRNTIENTIVPKIKWMIPPNSSYSAGYCNWFKCIDDISQTYFWCPPSIKALGIYLYTDRYAEMWFAPAGENRGKIDDAYDIAFNPTVEEAQNFYEQQWNYAVAYPTNGIVLEGQKTFQVDKTALDRVNVRRLCLAIKKGIYEIARWFKYEEITPLTLTHLRDQFVEFLRKVQGGNGISEYYVKLDEENNTVETIERNEIHATIAIRPIKTAEYIVITSVIANQSANLEEVTQSVLA